MNTEQIPEKEQVLQTIDNLIESNWPFVIEAAGDTPIYAISFKVTIDRRLKKSHVNIGASYTRSFKDAAEFWIEDPDQVELDLEEKEEAEDKPKKNRAKKAKAEPEPTILAIEETSSLPDMAAECLALPAPGEAAISGEEVVDAQFTEVPPTPAAPEHIPIDEAAVMFGLSVQYLTGCLKDGFITGATVRGEWMLDLASLRVLFKEVAK